MNIRVPHKAALLAVAQGVAVLLATASTGAQAVATLSMTPASSSVTVGQTFNIGITADGATEGIGAWNFVLGFTQPGLLQLTNIGFSNALGTIGTQALSFTGSDFGVVSLLSPAELIALQASQPITLVTLSFRALTVGSTQLTLTAPPLGELLADAFGNALQATVNRATVSVVPEPSQWVLLLAGLAGLAGVSGVAAGTRPSRPG